MQLRSQVVAPTAPIRPLAWEPLYATGAVLEKGKKTKKKKKKKKKITVDAPQKINK